MKERLGNPKIKSIALLVPITIELTSNEFLIVRNNFDLFEKIGFKIEEFGINSIIIKEQPLWLPKGNEEENIKQIVDLVIEKILI